MTRLSIAFLAHDEADRLPAALADLRAQTVFGGDAGAAPAEIVVVANGCTDDTAEAARRAFARLGFPAHVRCRVVDLPTPGKTNAWNVFVHELLDPAAEVVCMLDADIRMPQPDLIARALRALGAAPDARVASDVSVKDFGDLPRLHPMRLLNLAFERPGGGGGGAGFCGQFYCIRAEFLRRLVLPIGLLSQDGFLRAMILTEGLTRPENMGRIVTPPGAFHLHPAYTRLSQIYRFQKRQAIGTAIYLLIYRELERMPPSLDARMAEIRRRNAEDPGWVSDLIAERARDPENFVPRSYVRRMLETMRRARGLQRLKWLLAPAGLAFDAAVARAADAELRRRAVGSLEANRGKFRIRAQGEAARAGRT